MPYWSSSRVGAVPQVQPTKQKKRTERYNRKKGITMEDLKKQTAIRLAQEQQQGRSTPANSFVSGGQDRPQGVVQKAGRPSYNPEACHNTGSSISFHPVAAGPPQPSPVEDRYNPGTTNPLPTQGSSHGALVPSYRYDNAVLEEPVSTPVKQLTSSRSFHQEQQRSAPRPTKSSSSDASATMAKLPHGLTVHELKEMTKARLQAEASEKREHSSPEPLARVPSIVRESPDYQDRVAAPSPVISSPIPPSSSFARSPYTEPNNYQPPAESWSHDSRNDPWESGSVSTQTSDYVGAEQSFATFNGEETGFNRARSFSANSGIGAPCEYVGSRDAASPAFGQSQRTSPYFDSTSGFVPNRRRAATLSPRVCLTHLHEDRPVLPGQELPGLPSFSSGNYSQSIAPRANAVANLDYFAPSDQVRFHRSAGVIGGTSVEGNRPRTSSAVSLPAMSHTADEFAFALDHQPSSAKRSSHFSPLPEHDSCVPGLSDVFRESPEDGIPTPPGFIGGPELRVPPAMSSVGIGSIDSFGEPRAHNSFGEPRARASTWCVASSSSRGLFGPGLIGGGAGEEDPLADDLASILKLSGAEERELLSPPPGLL